MWPRTCDSVGTGLGAWTAAGDGTVKRGEVRQCVPHALRILSYGKTCGGGGLGTSAWWEVFIAMRAQERGWGALEPGQAPWTALPEASSSSVDLWGRHALCQAPSRPLGPSAVQAASPKPEQFSSLGCSHPSLLPEEGSRSLSQRLLQAWRGLDVARNSSECPAGNTLWLFSALLPLFLLLRDHDLYHGFF